MNCTQSNDTLGDYIGEILKIEIFTGGQKSYKHGKKTQSNRVQILYSILGPSE